ncbi:MAG: hypothetical protein ACLVES_06525 [Faecalibacterium prausnitzii]
MMMQTVSMNIPRIISRKIKARIRNPEPADAHWKPACKHLGAPSEWTASQPKGEADGDDEA